MRRITFSISLFWLVVSAIAAELTLESVNQKVNDLEVEVTALKVYDLKSMIEKNPVKYIFRAKTPS